MSKCYNCGKEFTLTINEIRCDNCKKIVNFPCNNCKEWFSIEGIKQCGFCGYYFCPKCGSCGKDCVKPSILIDIKEIIPGITEEQSIKLMGYIEELKTSKEQKKCFKGVPISYAKGRNKMCFVRLLGYRCKNEKDLEKFNERYQTIMDVPLGTILTVNQSREDGTYGQEYRDVFNLAICRGKLKVIEVEKIIDGEDRNFMAYQRIEESNCQFLDAKDLVVKVCPNKECKIKIYPYKETYCINPECKYKRGKKAGQLRELKLKISNKDICQLNGGDFKRDGERQSN